MMDRHVNNGPHVAGSAWAFGAISTIAILLRIYCRVFIVKCFGLDDWTAVIAQITYIAYCYCSISGVHYGTGQHVENILPENLPIALRYWWLCEPLYILVNMFIKLSIAVFLLRICNVKTHKVIIWIMLAVAELYGFAFFIVFILQCQPSSYFWERFSTHPPSHGSCFSVAITAGVFFAYSAICCITDWTLSILPGFIVWNLQMDKKTRLSVCAILAVSAIASMATLIRLPFLHTITDSADFLFATTEIAIWSTVELGIGITASTMPTLRPLFRKFFEGSRILTSSNKRFGSSGSKSTNSSAFQNSNRRMSNKPGIPLVKTGASFSTNINVLSGDEEMDIGSQEGGSENSRPSDNGASALEDDGRKDSNTHRGWNVKVSKSIVQTRDCV